MTSAMSAPQELKALPDLDAEQRYEQLVIPDIQAACDLLEPQYRASQGDDGYVSLKSRRRWRTTPRARWTPPAGCGRRLTGPTP